MTVPPVVSVLMPVYNGEQWLAQALESVLAQTFTDLEVVVVDDGSTDGSASIVELFAARDPRVRLVRAVHAGTRSSRSISLAEARGRFVAFLDADDEWLPVRLERQLPYVDERTVVFSDFFLVDDGDTKWGSRHSEGVYLPALDYPASGLFPDLLKGCFISIVTVLAPRERLLSAGAFRQVNAFQTANAEDWEMWLLLALRGVRFHYVDEPLALVRRHAGSLTADWLRVTEGEAGVYDRLLLEARGSDRRLVRRVRRQNRRRLEVAYRKRGWVRIIAGDSAAARHELTRSLRYRPRSPRAWLALAMALCPPLSRRIVQGRV